MSLHAIISRLIDIYTVIIVIYCLFTWFPRPNGGFLADVSNLLSKLCEPYLNIFRRFIPAMGGIDFSPILAIVVLVLLGRVLTWLLAPIGL